jgi:hypothetical protein
MRRRVLLYLTLIAMSACNGDKLVGPSNAPTNPSNDISDGNNCVTPGVSCLKGNPDFFFLPPMVKNPSTSSDWEEGTFNADLEPTIEVCESLAALEKDIASAGCRSRSTLTAIAEPAAEMYKVNWAVPTSQTVFYRLTVSVGTRQLGFADVKTASNASQLKNVDTDELIPLVDGRTLPIKFRIERYALCEVPGVGPCATKTVNLLGKATTIATPFSSDPLKPHAKNGLFFPEAAAGAAASAISPLSATTTSDRPTVTVERCTQDFHERGITDLPAFGPCIRVRIEPALRAPLSKPALVFSCDVTGETVEGISPHQKERITLHRLVGDQLEALPHDHPDCRDQTASQSTGQNVRRIFAQLRRGLVKSAAREMLAMLAPKPLYAARFIDLGGGGFSRLGDEGEGAGRSRSAVDGARLSTSATATGRAFHEFQFLLPARFDYGFTETDIPAFPQDQLTVRVRVTDLGNEPVKGARIRFSAEDQGTVTSTPAVTDEDGVATVPWTVSAISPNRLTAKGFGIAGVDANGPRRNGAEDRTDDPFQPCDGDWETLTSPSACAVDEKATGVGTGSMKVTAITVGKIGGTVINEQTGAPVAASISYQAGPSSPAGSASASNDGSFLIENVTPGTRAMPYGYKVTFTADKFELAERGAVAVRPKETTSLGKICLTPTPGKISGRITTTLDGSDVTDPVTVTVTEIAPTIAPDCQPEGSPAPTPTVRTVTTEAGNFLLEGLPPGNYSLVATSTDYFDKSIESITVSAATTTTQPVAMKWMFGAIGGSVMDQTDGRVVPGATVTASLEAAAEEPAAAPAQEAVKKAVKATNTLTVTADANGIFNLRRLSPGTYRLTATATDYNSATGTNTVVRASESTPAPPITLQYAFGSLAGTVSSQFDESALAGVKVTATSEYGEEIVFSGTGGAFRFDKLHIGSQSLQFEGAGYYSTTEAREVNSHQTASASGIALVPFVTSSATVDLPTYTGSCPAVITFTGTITSAVAGDVKYKWERSDSPNTPELTLTFGEPGTQTVTTTWRLGAEGRHWERIRLLTPTSAVSNKAEFVLTCTPP